MIARAYLEITNICNLDCIFCPKTRRKKASLCIDDFERLTDKLMGEVQFLYFHLMGEPMLNQQLPRFIERAREKGFLPVLTTNGTLLNSPIGDEVIAAHPHKIQISLHSQEGNGKEHPEAYIAQVMTFAKKAASAGIIVVLRLWNQGGYDSENAEILRLMEQHVPAPWTERYDGFRLSDHLYLEYDKMFEWPDEEHATYDETEVFCYALRNQVGILVDGTVVPCCLDHDGSVALGNLHTQTLAEILSSPRATALYEGFSHHTATEPLCQRCGYAAVTKRFRK